MKSIAKIWGMILLGISACSAPEQNLSLESTKFSLQVDASGNMAGLSDASSKENYLHQKENSPLLSIAIDGKEYAPDAARFNKEKGFIVLHYAKIGLSSTIHYVVKENHINFELKQITPEKKIDYVVWGPYKTRIGKTVGETVGVVQDTAFAIGIQALNIKTLGGYPTNMDDTEPAYDIFATNSLTDVSDSVKVLYRGQTARKTDYGSMLQAYCRNRSESKVIPVWGHEKYTVPAYSDGGVIGSKIAIFGSTPATLLDVISEIEVAEGLPHPLIKGEWAKTSPEATASYLIMPFDGGNLGEALQLTKKAGLKYLYHGGPFETWGHFKLQQKSFPKNWESLKELVGKAEKQGVHLGVHTLSNFITTNDPYVTPVPDKRLAKVGASSLPEPVDKSAKEIPIADPMFFNQMKNNNLHAVQVGDELIRYEKVTQQAPWKLLNCERGAFGTRAASHKKGAPIAKLMDHGYKTFLSNAELSGEIARRLAEFCNATGIRQISFDGLEGNWASGMGQYARQLFVQTWYKHLKPELQGEVINDASNPGHFFWHIFTRMNWGEPWYAGFRESQTQYRLMNQDYFDRNLMPNMLGWFALSPETSVMDVEWLLARSAGFDAGFGLSTSFEALRNNGKSELLLSKIKNWEQARLNGAFEARQKKLMKDIKKEFTLQQAGENKWQLREALGKVYHLANTEKQPGEPVFHSLEFSNNFDEQPLQFLLSAKENGEITRVKLELNNFTKIDIPVDLSNGNILSYEGGKKAVLYDKNWHVRQEIGMDQARLMVANGKHSLKVELEGSNKAAAKLELKVVGTPVLVAGKRNIRS
jgi:hypothetical protein